jgi:DNA-binding CsgD family transcriptional regulator
VDRVTRACYRAGDDLVALQARVMQELGRVVAFDAAFMAAADPGTLLFTAAFADDELAAAGPRFLDNEFAERPDVNRFVDLAAAEDPVGSLDRSTIGDWEASSRFRDIMAPLGLGDEARIALRVNGTTWGFVCLHRSGPTGFTVDDLDALRRIGPHFAAAIRRTVVASADAPPEQAPAEAAAPALVITAEDRVVALGGAAEHWLDQLGCDPVTLGRPLPLPLLAVVRRLAAIDRDPAAPPAALRLRARDGTLVSVNATHLRDAAGNPSVALAIGPATGADRTSLLLAAHDLTAAQLRVAQLVLRGLTTRQIMGRLRISEHTVQDHLKAVFDKVGVRSRRDLVAALMRPPG